MSWKPIVVGVDASSEGACAATTGAALAKAAGTTCHLVHATRDVVSAVALAEMPERAEEFAAAQAAQAREQLQQALQGEYAGEAQKALKALGVVQ